MLSTAKQTQIPRIYHILIVCYLFRKRGGNNNLFVKRVGVGSQVLKAEEKGRVKRL